jgi:hypothetical protein
VPSAFVVAIKTIVYGYGYGWAILYPGCGSDAVAKTHVFHLDLPSFDVTSSNPMDAPDDR